MPGDRLQMLSGVLHINGKPVGREYVESFKDKSAVAYKKYRETFPNDLSHFAYYLGPDEPDIRKLMDTTKVFIVPKDHYFMMGDNRNNSADSRMDMGFVPFENLIAKALL